MLEMIDRQFAQAVSRLWPDPPRPEFRPLVNLTWGDAGSDFCIRAAAALKIPPQQVALMVEQGIGADFPGECTFVEGFLNLRLKFAVFERGCNAAPEALLGAPVSLIVAPMNVRRDPLAYLRLLSLSVVQLSILRSLGVDCRLAAEKCSAAEGSQSGDSVSVFRDIASAQQGDAVLGSPAVRFRLENFIEANHGHRIFIWLYPGSLDKPDYVRLIRRYRGRVALLGV